MHNAKTQFRLDAIPIGYGATYWARKEDLGEERVYRKTGYDPPWFYSQSRFYACAHMSCSIHRDRVFIPIQNCFTSQGDHLWAGVAGDYAYSCAQFPGLRIHSGN